MPHIDLQNELPGIRGLMAFRPDTAAPLSALAEILLRDTMVYHLQNGSLLPRMFLTAMIVFIVIIHMVKLPAII